MWIRNQTRSKRSILKHWIHPLSTSLAKVANRSRLTKRAARIRQKSPDWLRKPSRRLGNHLKYWWSVSRIYPKSNHSPKRKMGQRVQKYFLSKLRAREMSPAPVLWPKDGNGELVPGRLFCLINLSAASNLRPRRADQRRIKEPCHQISVESIKRCYLKVLSNQLMRRSKP